MNLLIDRLAGLVKGCITGFDRIVFKGIIRPLAYAEGAMSFCQAKNILNKDYKGWMLKQTATLVEHVNQYAKEQCGQGIIPIKSWRIRKEAIAHERQQNENIDTGLIGIWSCLESGSSYRAHYCEKTGYPQLQNYPVSCKHLYFYFDHEDYGFMNIRLQTWFPYHIQICLNGREWLRRLLEKQGIDFCMHGNKFLDIANYQESQNLLDSQLDTCWPDMLNSFLPTVFPTMPSVLGPHLAYYWTMWQSEWATDMIFESADSLNPIMNPLLSHAFITGTSSRVLRYMDRPLTKDGNPYARSNDEIYSRVLDFNDGIRVRHWNDQNSVKVYNEQNNLRVETTINRPDKFRVFRNKQGQSPSEPKERLPLRKGVADVPLRAKVSQEINERFMNDIATFKDETPFRDLIKNVAIAQKKDGRRIRALEITGKDRELLQALDDPAFLLSGLTNKMLRERLQDSSWVANRSDKQIAARVSRHFRLLRDHGIIRKLPNQNRYQVTIKGAKLIRALNVILSTSTDKLIKTAA